ncbi:ABC transporter permease subunit [Haladaptatus caseinilyticus]|uniref:ABC transporter permease subunit n=1 Tax=Haladaptatus caseinilyticus TaxID=2993314 RepID=UPI00224A9B84|nr:ABC transporter permease subunit [Haladaptatus caseinilyticus]
MFEIARYEGKRRVRGSLALGGLLALMSLLFIGFFPSVTNSGVDLDAYLESMPPALQATFGEASLTTIEGFLAIEMYQFFWLLLLGVYVAYVAGALIAGDEERGRMDILLATPISRTTVVIEKFCSLGTPILVVNVAVPVAVFLGVVLVGESIDVTDLVMVHLLSIPYLLACGAIGLLLSVVAGKTDLAQRGGLGAVFGLFLLDSIGESAGMDWVGGLSPTQYYDPTAILVSGEYDWTGVAVLLIGTVILVSVSVYLFQRRDVR